MLHFIYAELLKDPVSLKEILDVWTDLFKQRVAMACFRENSTELVGVNMVFVTTKDEKDDYESKVGRFSHTVGNSYIKPKVQVFRKMNNNF